MRRTRSISSALPMSPRYRPCRPDRPPRTPMTTRKPRIPLTPLLRQRMARMASLQPNHLLRRSLQLSSPPRANRKLLLPKASVTPIAATQANQIRPPLLLALLLVWSDSSPFWELASSFGASRRESPSPTSSILTRSSTITSRCLGAPTRGSMAISWHRGVRAMAASMTTRISPAGSYR